MSPIDEWGRKLIRLQPETWRNDLLAGDLQLKAEKYARFLNARAAVAVSLKFEFLEREVSAFYRMRRN